MQLKLKYLLLICLFALPTLAQIVIHYPFGDDGAELNLGTAVKVNSSGEITACADNDSDVVGVIVAKSVNAPNRYYLVASSDLAHIPLPSTVSTMDRLTTAASGGLRTATDGEVIVGTACDDGDDDPATLERVLLSINYADGVSWDTLAAYSDTTVTNDILDSLGHYIENQYSYAQSGSFWILYTGRMSSLLVDSVAILNESGNSNFTFRIEGDSDPNLIFIDAINDRVGIGTDSPAEKLDVAGGIMMRGERYWGLDASGADSFWIYDTGDTVFFDADNPIVIGDRALTIESDNDIRVSEQFYIGDVPDAGTADSLLVIEGGWIRKEPASSFGGDFFDQLRADAGAWLTDSVTLVSGDVTLTQTGDSITFDTDWDTLSAYADTTITSDIYDSLGAYADTSIVWDTLSAYADTSILWDTLTAYADTSTVWDTLSAYADTSVVWDTLTAYPDTTVTNNILDSLGAYIERQYSGAQDASFWVEDTGRVGHLVVDSSAVINEGGGDHDFRVEGDTDANLFFTDASADRVGIGTNTPTQKFEISGALRLEPGIGVAEASDTSGVIWVKSVGAAPDTLMFWDDENSDWLAVSPPRPNPKCQVYGGGNTNCNPGPTVIPFTNETRVDDEFTHDNGSNPSRVYVTEDGYYKITYQIPFNNNVNDRIVMHTYVRQNGTTSLGGDSYCYLRRDNYGMRETASGVVYLTNLTAGDYVEVVGEVYDGPTGTTYAIDPECWLTIERENVGEGGGGGGGAGATQWSDAGTFLYPTNVGRNIQPNVTGTVGEAGGRWDNVYSVDGNFSNDVTISGGVNDGVDFGISGYCLKTDGSGDIYWATDNTGGSFAQLRADAGAWLTDSVTFISGTNITLTQTGDSITIDNAMAFDTLQAYRDTLDHDFQRLRAEANPWLLDSLTIVAGSNVTLNQSGDTITISSSGTPGGNFERLCVDGDPWLYDSVRFVEGTDVTLTQAGNTITITSTGSSKWTNGGTSLQPTDFNKNIVKNNNGTVGEAGTRWDNIYSVDGNFSNDVTISNDLTIAGGINDGVDFGTSGYCLKTDGSGDIYWAEDNYLDGEAAGGDLAGTYPNPTISNLPSGDVDYIWNQYTSAQAGSLWIDARARVGHLIVDSSVVINETGGDHDFRVEGDTDANLIFADASADRVGIGTATPGYKLDISGDIAVSGGLYDGASLGTANQVLTADGAGGFAWADLPMVSYTQSFDMFQVGAASTWETVHLVDYNANVEPGALCEVIVANRSGWAERWGGVRETGSSDNRYAQLHEAEAGGYDFVTMQVVADDDTCIEAYAENTGDIEFYLIGWQVNGASGGGGGGGSSEWNDGGTYLYPTDVGRDIRPNTSGTVGDAGTRWNGIYSVDGDFSNDVTISGGINDGVDFGISGYCLKTDGSGDIYWATDNTGGSFEKLRSEANPWLADSVTFAAGSNVSIAQIGDSIIISSSGTPGGNFVRLCASGSPWLYDSVRFVAGSNITLLQSSNAITISAVITGAIENQKASAQDADFWIDDTGRVGQLVVDSSAVINESGGNYDFRVEGDTDDTLLFTDASEDKIGIGTGSPQHKLDVNGAMYSRRHALTDGATIAVDWNDGNVQSVTLGGNRTFTFSNGQDGGKYILIITQDATGSRTVTWPGTVRWGLCGEPTLSTTANTTDYIGFIYNGVSSTYDAIAVRLGY